MTPPMTPIDRDIADAFAALDRTSPERGQEEFTSRVMARISDGEGVPAAPRVAVGRESPPGTREDSGLHDIVALASRAKQRLSERDQSESDAGESVMLAAAPGGLRAVALPDPSRVARSSAAPPPREPTRTDGRSSLPFWALGSVATLAAAAAVAVFVFGIGRGADRSVDSPASSAESAPAGGLAQLDPPARDPAAAEGQRAPSKLPESPAPPPAAQEGREWVEAASEERRPKEYARRVRPRERADTGGETARSAEAVDESAAAKVESGKDAEGSPGAPSSAPGGVAAGAAGPGESDASDVKAGGDANLEDMLDAVTEDEKPKSTPPAEAAPEPPARAEKKELDRRAVSAALEAIRDEVQRCHEVEKFAGSVTVKFAVAPSGQVSKAAAIGTHIRSKTGTCVARAVLQARFPAFEGTPISITYPFLLSR